MGKASRRAKRERRERRRRTRWWQAGGAAAAVVVAAGVAYLLLGHAPSSGPQTSSGGPPDFSMVAYQGQDVLGGHRIDFAHLVGQGRPVVLNFWAGRCPACRAEMPGFQAAYENLGSEYTMIGVDVGPYVSLGSHADARAFLHDHAITYPAAYATNSAPLREYRVQGMPTTVIFDATGKIVTRHTGYFAASAFRRQLQPLLAKGP